MLEHLAQEAYFGLYPVMLHFEAIVLRQNPAERTDFG
jgi:hypothetical protein